MKKKNILLVDDEPIILKILGRYLKEEGYEVTTASNGKEAIALLKKGCFDIIVTDLVMPGISGIQVLSKAKELDPDMPVLIITGYGALQAAIDALRLGADEYLLKPCDISDLLHRISRCLETHNLRRENKKHVVDLEETNKKLKAEISERKQAVKELLKKEEKFRNLAEFSPNMIFINKKGRVVYANKKCVHIMGYKRKEFYSADFDFRCLIAPESLEFTERIFKIHMSGKDVIPYEYTILTKNGKRIESIITTKLIDYEGETAILGIITDITEQKRAERKLEKYSEQLEEMVKERTKELQDAQEKLVRKEKLAMLGMLSSGVGHELRNPLSVMSNAIYYLKMIIPDSDKNVKEYMDMISSEIDNANTIVSDLLDFPGIKQSEKEEFVVSELISQVLAKQSTPEEINIVTEITSNLSSVYADPRQIGQVLTNLFTNACQAMPEGGNLTVKAEDRGDKVQISINDTGCGISSKEREKIFEPLFTTKSRGIGLGLSITKNILGQNGGSIEVKSEEGKGSTFTITLPANKT